MYSSDDEEDFVIVPFIQSEDLCSRRMLDSLNDLRRYFEALTSMIKRNFIKGIGFWNERHEETTKILESYEDFDDDVSYYVDKNLFLFDERPHDDEDAVCIKTMLIIYHYFVISRQTMRMVDTSIFIPFFHYIEHSIVPKVFHCAKKLKKEAEKGQLNEFETGIEDLEPWQKIILHLYSELQSEIFSYHNEDPDMSVYYNSCFVMLTLLKYFKEKKDKCLKENHGQYWKKENQQLVNTSMSFWPPFLKEVFTHDTAELRKLKNLFSNCVPVFIEYLHRITGLTFDDDGEDLKADLVKLLTISKIVNTRNEWWNHWVSIMKEDYEEVKEMENMSIITNEQSKNFGEYVYIIKNKIMNSLGFVLADQDFEDGDEDEVRDETSLRVSLLVYFKDFIIENLKRTEDETPAEKFLKGTTNGVALPITCLDIDILDEIPHEFLQLISSIVEIWKNTLLFTDRFVRSSVNTSLSGYFSRQFECSDDLLLAIINAQHANITNFKEYSKLLVSAVNCFSDFEMEESLLERFRELINNLFETIIMSDTMEYLEEGSEEEKIETHYNNVILCFSMICSIYKKFFNCIPCEKLLFAIKKKTEEVLNGNEYKTKTRLLWEILWTLTNVVKQTDQNILSKALDELEYYPFLTKFIRFIISHQTVQTKEKISISDIQPLAPLIATLYENRLLENCPFDVDETQSGAAQNKDILYDYLFKILVEAAIPPYQLIKHLPVVNTSNPNIVRSIEQCSKALIEIIYNEIIRNGGERLLSHLESKHLENIKLLLTDDTFHEFATKFEESLVVILFLTRGTNLRQYLRKYLTKLLMISIKGRVRCYILQHTLDLIEYFFYESPEQYELTACHLLLNALEVQLFNIPLSLHIHIQRIDNLLETMDLDASDEDEEDSDDD